MTDDQFAALAQLLQLRVGKAQTAAHMVLVGGHRPSEVALLLEMQPASVSNATSRMRRGLALARAVAAE